VAVPARIHPRFPLVDSMRGLAALSIVVFHGAGLFGHAMGPQASASPYVARLEVGVSVFFLISAFLLYRPFVAARDAGEDGPSTGPYAWRRLVRIVPAYWVALTVVVVWMNVDGVFTARGIPTYYGFAQIYSASTIEHGMLQAWTLCVELSFYAFLPLWAWAMRRLARGDDRETWLRRELLALVALAAASVAYKVIVLWGAHDDTVPAVDPLLSSLPGYLDQFAIGMALAVLSVRGLSTGTGARAVAAVRRRPGLLWAGALVVLVVVANVGPLSGNPTPPYTRVAFLERDAVYAIVALLLFLPAVTAAPAGERTVTRRFLALPALLWVGAVSYGIYLYHLLVLTKLNEWGYGDLIHGSAIAWALAGIAGSIVLGAASYYLIERPLIRSSHRGRRPPGPAGLGETGPLDSAREVAAARPAAGPTP